VVNKDDYFQDYAEFDDVDNMYETDEPIEEQCLWIGKPHLLCYIIDRNYIIFMFFLLIFWHFDFDFRWYSFVNYGILLYFIIHVINTFRYAKTIKYYITKTHLIVKLEEQYWAYPRENIAIRRQKIKNFPKKAQFFFGLLGGFKQARVRQSIIEKLFDVKRVQFIKKDIYSPVFDSSHDIYMEKGNFRCIKDYEKVIKILGI
jgi:hypothetical protein